jgi:hypothetical protein
MKSNRMLAIALLVVGSVGFGGCGGGADVNQHVTTVSQGKELGDLKRALDLGAIDQKEYDKLQKAILKRGY